VQQQPSDPLSGVMATSKKQVEIQMYLSKFKIVGAAHAQESQSLQAGSHLARHRLHLRPAEWTGAEPFSQSQPELEETAAAAATLGRRGGRAKGHHAPPRLLVRPTPPSLPAVPVSRIHPPLPPCTDNL
jgi:hypothetical protein